MSLETHDDIFTEVVNDMMNDLHDLPRSTTVIYQLIVNNINSPVLAVIHNLSLTSLNITQMAALLPALARMTDLTSLALPDCHPSPDHLKYLLTECQALSKLRSLTLSDVKQFKSEDVLLLSQSTTLTNLTSLNLTRCHIMSPRSDSDDDSGHNHGGFNFGSLAHIVMDDDQRGEVSQAARNLIALLSSPVVKNLTHLGLGNTYINDPEVYLALATSPHLSNLVSLDLACTLITAKGVAALAASTTLVNLVDLNLSYNTFNDDSFAVLFSPSSLLPKKLQSINLKRAEVTVPALKALSKACPHLTQLIVAANRELGSAGAAFVAANMPNLIKLDLAFCDISDDGYAALASSNTLTNLRELRFSDNPARAESIIALINSPVLVNLTRLDIGSSCKGPEVLTAIAQSPTMSKLQHLDCSGNEAGYRGILALSQSTTLTNLTTLDLSENRLGPKGVHALCTSPVVSKLTSLDLSYNPAIGNSIATALAAPSSNLQHILELHVAETKLDDKGVLQLLATPNLDQMNVLEITTDAPKIKKSTKAVYRARFDERIRH